MSRSGAAEYPKKVGESWAHLAELYFDVQTTELTLSHTPDSTRAGLACGPAASGDTRATVFEGAIASGGEGSPIDPWKVDPAGGDLFPEMPTGTPGIGKLEACVDYIAIGGQGTDAMEGMIYQRDDSDQGGVTVLGLRNVDPQNPPAPPLAGNAPLELNGSATIVMTGGLWIELQQAIDTDHELILQPSQTLADGRIVAPIVVGPEKVYTQQEQATDNQDHDVLDSGEVEIVSLTLTNSYAVNVSTFSFRVMLDNPGNQSTLFDVILKVDGVEAGRYPRTLVGNNAVVADSFPIQTPVTAGQVISLDVEAISTGPQSQGWVRGTLQPTTITIGQG